MKSLVFGLLMAALGISENLQASQVICDGFAMIPGNYITGNCSNGNCTASLYGTNVTTSGSCSNGVSFTAYGNLPGGFIQGICQNGQINANLPAGYIQWNGTCSNGAIFNASPSFNSGGFVFGSCQDNGFFSLQTPSSQASLNAECSTND